MDKQRCVVPNCNSKRRVQSHRFPKRDVEGCKWVEAVNNPHLKNLTYSEIFESRYRVCHLHFLDSDYVGPRKPGAKLKKETIPSLLLPDKGDVHLRKRMIDVSTESTPKKLKVAIGSSPIRYTPTTTTRVTTPLSCTQVRKSSFGFVDSAGSSSRTKVLSVLQMKVSDVVAGQAALPSEVVNVSNMGDPTMPINTSTPLTSKVRQAADDEDITPKKSSVDARPGTSRDCHFSTRSTRKVAWKKFDFENLTPKAKRIYEVLKETRGKAYSENRKLRRYNILNCLSNLPFETKYTKETEKE